MTAAVVASVGRKKVGREMDEARGDRDEEADEVMRRDAGRRSFEVAMAAKGASRGKGVCVY